MEQGSLAIDVRDLKKVFGRREALTDINLKLKDGEFLTIFGPNGAGKTTFLKILSTLISPTSGEVFISSFSVTDEPTAIRGKIGLISHSPLLYLDLTAYENLKFYGRMYGLDNLEKRIGELLDRVELSHRRFDRVRTFSRGMLQRLSIARALLHEPEILFLDEPYAGLDPHAVDILDSLLGDLRAHHTFPSTSLRTCVMVTHDVEKGFSLSSQVVILSQGKIVFERGAKEIDLPSLKKAYREKVKEGL